MRNKRVGSIRLLETGYNNAVFNMALDEVLMRELEVSSRKDRTTDKIKQDNIIATSRNWRVSPRILNREVTVEKEPFASADVA
ncbi:MAG: hypothetical protein WBC70_08105, partial [Candidatus Aminicenantales bacterium]